MVEKKENTKSNPSTSLRTKAKKTSVSAVDENQEMNVSSKKPETEKLVIKVNKSIIPLTVAVVILLGVLYYFKGVFIVAMVNGQPIPRFTVVQELEKQSGKQITSALVTKILIFQEAKKKNVSVNDKEINDEVKKIEQNLSKQGQNIDTVLAEQGMIKKDLTERIKIQKIVEKLFAKDIKVTDKEIKEYFDKNKALFGEDAKYEKVKDTISQQLQQIKLNEKFQTWVADLQKQAKIDYFVSY